MVKQVTFTMSTGYIGSEREETFTFVDLGVQDLEGEDLESELNEALKEWIWEKIDSGYKVGESSE